MIGGTVINPPIVEARSMAQPRMELALALMENCVYDGVGNMLTSHLQRLHAHHGDEYAQG